MLMSHRSELLIKFSRALDAIELGKREMFTSFNVCIWFVPYEPPTLTDDTPPVIAENTIESKVLEIQERKRLLIKQVSPSEATHQAISSYGYLLRRLSLVPRVRKRRDRPRKRHACKVCYMSFAAAALMTMCSQT